MERLKKLAYLPRAWIWGNSGTGSTPSVTFTCISAVAAGADVLCSVSAETGSQQEPAAGTARSVQMQAIIS